MKAFFQKYSFVRYLIYLFAIYLIGFFVLEQRSAATSFIDTSTWIDQYIPFNEYFVIPYILWFGFIALGFLYFIFIDRAGFQRTCFYLFVGMYTCLLIYFLFPNGQNLRVEIAHENIFQDLVGLIYTVDTSTNVFPSIHVYNSLMMSVTLFESERVRKHPLLIAGIVVLSISICLSTVMIKQHAFIDIIAAIVLSIIVFYAYRVMKKYKKENI